MSISRTAHRAMIDEVCEDPEGMSEIRDLGTAKAVIEEIMSPTKLPWVLERIAASRFPNELLLLLAKICGGTHLKILPLMHELMKGEEIFDSIPMQVMADHYWSLVVRERIIRGDYRRGWDEIRRSFWGFSTEEHKLWLAGPGPRQPHLMTASDECIATLTNELYTSMRAKELVADIDLNEKPDVDLEAEFSRPSGILFAIVTKGYTNFGTMYHPNERHGKFSLYGRQVLVIAGYFSEKQKEAKRNRRERKLAAKS